MGEYHNQYALRILDQLENLYDDEAKDNQESFLLFHRQVEKQSF